jgi:hypothetical protein
MENILRLFAGDVEVAMTVPHLGRT